MYLEPRGCSPLVKCIQSQNYYQMVTIDIKSNPDNNIKFLLCRVNDTLNVPSCWATQLPLILDMISKNTDSGVGGNIKFFAEANFILMTTKRYLCIGRRLRRTLIHTHHTSINLYFSDRLEPIWIRICNVEMKILGCTPSFQAFSKWLPRQKNRNCRSANFGQKFILSMKLTSVPLLLLA